MESYLNQSSMKTITKIKNQIQAGSFEFNRHAFRRIIERNISEDEIKQIGENLEMIEDYPDDKYSPSCLLLGFTRLGRPLHIQVSRIDSEITKIITIYEPNKHSHKIICTVILSEATAERRISPLSMCNLFCFTA